MLVTRDAELSVEASAVAFPRHAERKAGLSEMEGLGGDQRKFRTGMVLEAAHGRSAHGNAHGTGTNGTWKAE